MVRGRWGLATRQESFLSGVTDKKRKVSSGAEKKRGDELGNKKKEGPDDGGDKLCEKVKGKVTSGWTGVSCQ